MIIEIAASAFGLAMGTGFSIRHRVRRRRQGREDTLVQTLTAANVKLQEAILRERTALASHQEMSKEKFRIQAVEILSLRNENMRLARQLMRK